MARLLITGGAGFIDHNEGAAGGSHDLVVLDSFANSSTVALNRVAELAGREVQMVLRCPHFSP